MGYYFLLRLSPQKIHSPSQQCIHTLKGTQEGRKALSHPFSINNILKKEIGPGKSVKF
jgi:hypothetical protein